MSTPTGQWQCQDIDSIYIQQITEDDSSGVAYGNVEQVQGAADFSIKPKFITSESYGDGQILDYYSRIKEIESDFKYVVNKLSALATMLGGSIIPSGTTPNQVLEASFTTQQLPYFRVDAQCKYVGPFGNSNGDAHLYVAKAIVSDWSYKLTAEKRHELSGKFMGFPLVYNDPVYGHQVFKLAENETATNWSVSTYTNVAPTVASTTPASAATGVDSAAITTSGLTVTMTSSGSRAKIDPRTVNQANFVVFDSTDGTITATTASLDSTGYIVTLAGTFVSGKTYQIIVTEGVRDIYGNALAAVYVDHFATA